MQIEDKVFVVTGGGSGIGRELVLNLLGKGAQVAAVDINAAALAETAVLAGDHATALSTHVASVADRDAVEALPDAVVAAHGGVDAIINNAGIIQPFVRINDLDLETMQRVLDVNLYGVLYMTKAFLPLLLERPEAHIANISSMGGFLPVPGQTLYGATKAAVKLLTEGLYAELQGSNVGVTVIFPGAIATNIAANSGIDVGEGAGDASQSTPADAAAETIVQGIADNAYRVLVGPDAEMMDNLYRQDPQNAVMIITQQMANLLPPL